MADLLIGLDVGTTGTKAVLFDPQGRVIAAAGRGYALHTPQPGWVEQDPEEIWAAVVTTLRELSAHLGPGDARNVALAQSSQGGTTISVDAEGRPLHRALSWMDTRAHVEEQRLRADWGDEAIRTLTGWPIVSGLPLLHIAWLAANCPAEFAATARFLFVNDFIGYRLTGQHSMNPADASITQLMSLATGDWDDRLLAWAGITRDRLSPVSPSGMPIGKLTAAASAATGLPQDTMVVNGAHDQYCAAAGTGVIRPGRVLLSCGTAWVLLAVPESLERGLTSGMAISRHSVASRFGAIRSLGAVGTSLEWLLDQVWGGANLAGREQLYPAINEGVAQTPPGASGLIFLPLAGGQLSGFGPANGGFLHLTLGHSRNHMARAVMEGIACDLRWAIDEIREAGVPVAELTMVGGAAKSPVWPQIVADVLHVPVTVPVHRDAAARGAAILAGLGAGCFSDVESAGAAWQMGDSHVEPDETVRRVYDDLYERYREAAQRFAGEVSGARQGGAA
jgi:xylulokinase